MRKHKLEKVLVLLFIMFDFKYEISLLDSELCWFIFFYVWWWNFWRIMINTWFHNRKHCLRVRLNMFFFRVWFQRLYLIIHLFLTTAFSVFDGLRSSCTQKQTPLSITLHYRLREGINSLRIKEPSGRPWTHCTCWVTRLSAFITSRLTDCQLLRRPQRKAFFFFSHESVSLNLWTFISPFVASLFTHICKSCVWKHADTFSHAVNSNM